MGVFGIAVARHLVGVEVKIVNILNKLKANSIWKIQVFFVYLHCKNKSYGYKRTM
jgi:hypothetical protein